MTSVLSILHLRGMAEKAAGNADVKLKGTVGLEDGDAGGSDKGTRPSGNKG